jgi:hypothetical protein
MLDNVKFNEKLSTPLISWFTQGKDDVSGIEKTSKE